MVKQQRPEGFCLWVFESNAPARAFYANRGLIELERTDGSANEEKAPDVRMAWLGSDPAMFLRGLLNDVDEQAKDLADRREALVRALEDARGALRDGVRPRVASGGSAQATRDQTPGRVCRHTGSTSGGAFDR